MHRRFLDGNTAARNLRTLILARYRRPSGSRSGYEWAHRGRVVANLQGFLNFGSGYLRLDLPTLLHAL